MLERLSNLRHAGRMLAALPREARFPFRPRAEIEARRDARLRETIRLACRAVPYYRERMAALGLTPEEFRSIDDLARLPVTPIDDLRDAPREFLSARVNPDRCQLLRSGGTTGNEKWVWHDPASLLMNVAFSERQEFVIARFVGHRLRQRQLVINSTSSVSSTVRAAYRRRLALLRPLGPRRVRTGIMEPFMDQVAALNRLRPEVLITNGLFIGDFYERLQRAGLAPHRPRVIVAGAETLPADQRRRIEHDFGIPVIMTYQSTESLKIGFECEYRRGYHLHEDLCVVRLLDADGRPVPPGAVGRIHITNLVNRATVLLNFDQGDTGRFLDEPCPCGRTLRRLELVGSRQWPLLRALDGRTLHGADVIRPVKEHTAVTRVQILVERPDLWRVLYTDPRNETTAAWRRDTARRLERAVAGPGITVRLEQRDQLETTPAGKHSPVLIRCPQLPPYAPPVVPRPSSS